MPARTVILGHLRRSVRVTDQTVYCGHYDYGVFFFFLSIFFFNQGLEEEAQKEKLPSISAQAMWLREEYASVS